MQRVEQLQKTQYFPPELNTPTPTDQADGTQEASFSVVHFQWQELLGKCKDKVCQGPKTCIVHLSPVQRKAIGEGHRVLLWGVSGADPENLLV